MLEPPEAATPIRTHRAGLYRRPTGVQDRPRQNPSAHARPHGNTRPALRRRSRRSAVKSPQGNEGADPLPASALEAIATVDGAALGRLEGDFRRFAALGANGSVELPRAAASAATTAAAAA